MPKKHQRGQKLDNSQLFTNNKEEDLEWAHSKNHEDSSPSTKNNNTPASASASSTIAHTSAEQQPYNQKAIQSVKAAKFGNFRNEEPRRTAGVHDDMKPPFVAFVKTFGRQMTEAAMETYFPETQIDHMILINCEKALFCFIEFRTREDLGRALLVSGAKMMYQHPCTIDIASPPQIEKFVADKLKKQEQAERRLRRQEGSRNARSSMSSTSNLDEMTMTMSSDGTATPMTPSTPINFVRNAIFGTQQAPAMFVPSVNTTRNNDNNNNKRNNHHHRSNQVPSSEQSAAPHRQVNFNEGRNIFNSATPISAGDLQKLNNDNGTSATSFPPRYNRNDKNNKSNTRNNDNDNYDTNFASDNCSASSCSKFSEFSRGDVFGTASSPCTPQSSPNAQHPSSSGNNNNKPHFTFNSSHFPRGVVKNTDNGNNLNGHVNPSNSSCSNATASTTSSSASSTEQEAIVTVHKKTEDVSRDSLFGRAVITNSTASSEDHDQHVAASDSSEDAQHRPVIVNSSAASRFTFSNTALSNPNKQPQQHQRHLFSGNGSNNNRPQQQTTNNADRFGSLLKKDGQSAPPNYSGVSNSNWRT